MSVSGFLFSGSLPVAICDSAQSTAPKRRRELAAKKIRSEDEGKSRSRVKSKKLKSVPCRYWTGKKGSCKFGNNCNFIHDNSCAASSSSNSRKR